MSEKKFFGINREVISDFVKYCNMLVCVVWTTEEKVISIFYYKPTSTGKAMA